MVIRGKLILIKDFEDVKSSKDAGKVLKMQECMIGDSSVAGRC